MRNENVISVLSRGGRELFHSSVIAWLLDETGSHGLGRSFLDGVLEMLPFDDRYLGTRLNVQTEVSNGRGGRFDITLTPADRPDTFIVLENKTKSLGNHSQLDNYAAPGVDVGLLAMVPEMFDEESRSRSRPITYRQLHGLLSQFELDKHNGYQFVVDQYREHLDNLLRPYEAIKQLAESPAAVPDRLEKEAEFVASTGCTELAPNDWRTISYYYLHLLLERVKATAPDLVFDDVSEAGSGMAWNIEKNLRGPAFMEAVLRDPLHLPKPWLPRDDFRPFLAGSNREGPIEPPILRIELWLDKVAKASYSPEISIGWCALGLYYGVPGDVWKFFQTTEPYASKLNGTKRRNFHVNLLTLADLSFDSMIAKLRDTLSFAYDTAG